MSRGYRRGLCLCGIRCAKDVLEAAVLRVLRHSRQDCPVDWPVALSLMNIGQSANYFQRTITGRPTEPCSASENQVQQGWKEGESTTGSKDGGSCRTVNYRSPQACLAYVMFNQRRRYCSIRSLRTYSCDQAVSAVF